MKSGKNIIYRLKNIDLYMKEKLVIGIVLIGFALSAISLPIIKEQMYETGIPEDTLCISYETVENTNDTESGESCSNLEDTKDIEDMETDGSDSGTEGGESIKDGEKTVNDKDSTINNDTSNKNANSKDSSSSPNRPSPTPTTTSPISSDSSDTSGKIWVQPVYETVHHEAVYGTKRVYICNYCSAVFNSAGEFQVHKDENGG